VFRSDLNRYNIDLRVIAGSVGGIRLSTLPGRATRPMLDKTKEAVFSALGDRHIRNVNVWDMYGGSGALGIESLSRGATYGLFTEMSPKAIAIIKENLAKTKLVDRSKVIRTDVNKFLKNKYTDDKKFSLVFCDPPFVITSPNIEEIFESDLVNDDCVVVYQREDNSKTREFEFESDVFECFWERKYASSIIYFLTKK
jgi:16S rRNA (guanine966-N2)-methyltransferase